MASSSNNSQTPGTDENQGEGDKKSAKRYNEMQKDFVNSERGREEIEHAGEMSDKERAEAERAEQVGRSHAKGEDPAVKEGKVSRDKGA